MHVFNHQTIRFPVKEFGDSSAIDLVILAILLSRFWTFQTDHSQHSLEVFIPASIKSTRNILLGEPGSVALAR